jgi:hypothetical protein
VKGEISFKMGERTSQQGHKQKDQSASALSSRPQFRSTTENTKLHSKSPQRRCPQSSVCDAKSVNATSLAPPTTQLISNEKETSMLKIEVSNMGLKTRSHILASCKVKLTSEDGIDSVSIFDARVMRNRNGQLWVAWPSQYIREYDQSERYVPILVFSAKLEHRIAEAVLAAYEGYRTTSFRPGVSRDR